MGEDDERNRPLYMISVAAESKGLVSPKRSSGNTRLYSRADIERLDLIGRLTDEGINLAGVVRILDMRSQMDELDAEVEKLRAQIKDLREQVHEYRMRETITALAPYNADPKKAITRLLGDGPDVPRADSAQDGDGETSSET